MYFWRKKQHRKLRREIYSFFDTSISIALVQKREKDGRSVLACAKSDRNREPSSSSSISGSPLLLLVPEAFIYSLLGNFATQTAFIIFVIGMKLSALSPLHADNKNIKSGLRRKISL